MISVFYDFETTDAHFLGQILNYAFIAVDEAFRPRQELCGVIKLSRLQLPAPGAIRTNRVHVLRHQEHAKDSEETACRKILGFLQDLLDRDSEGVRLIGFNSAKFDLPYLRTSCIRNGLNPYISGRAPRAKLLHGDVFRAVRKIATTSEEFSRRTIVEDESGSRRVLKLDHIARAMGVSAGPQTHDSRDDVLLTISLSQALLKEFGTDVRTFSPYEGHPYHRGVKRGEVCVSTSPQYDVEAGSAVEERFVSLHDFSGSGALWLDIESYEAGEGRNALFWKQTNDGELFLTRYTGPHEKRLHAAALRAHSELGEVSLANFFRKSCCDIEQDIYRLDFAAREAFEEFLTGSPSANATSNITQDGRVLLSRYKLRSYIRSVRDEKKFIELLSGYGTYRYGGEAIINKHATLDDLKPEDRHPTVMSYLSEIREIQRGGDSEDIALMEELLSFYEQSDLWETLRPLLQQ